MKQFTEVGFLAALVFEFEKAWTIPRSKAVTFANDCMPASFGDDGYDWSLDGAKALVRDYVEAHGETA